MKINELIQKIKQQCTYIDRVYWLLFGVLIIVAILALFSASSTLAFAGDNTLNPIMNQMFFIVVGVALAFAIQFMPRSWIRIGGYIGLIVSIVLLILTYTSMGVETVHPLLPDGFSVNTWDVYTTGTCPSCQN